MKKFAAAAALTAALAVTVPAMAQQKADQANFGNVISALNNVSAQIDQINALNQVGEIRVVTVEDTLKGNNVEALNNALNKNDVNVLRDSLNNNEVIKNAFNDNNVAIDDVVAVEVLSGGDIVVYTYKG